MPKKNDASLQRRINAGKKFVLAEAPRMRKGLGKAKSSWKSDGTRVTDVDIAISKSIFRQLAHLFPDDDYFSEELAQPSGPVKRVGDFTWILDPVDGTNNYAMGIPNCAISLGLLRDGVPVYGFVYDLARAILIHGGPDMGAWDGRRRVTVTKEKPHGDSTVGFHSPYQKHLAPMVAPVVANFKIRGLGSSALHLAYVATGMLDAVLDLNVKVWDIAGAYPICQGAGGEIKFLNGPQFPLENFDLEMGRIQYIAGSKQIVKQIKKVLEV